MGVAVLFFMSRFEMLRQFLTASTRFERPYDAIVPAVERERGREEESGGERDGVSPVHGGASASALESTS